MRLKIKASLSQRLVRAHLKGQVSSTLHAMQVDDKIATSAVRVSLDENNTMAQADKFNQIFDDIYQKFLKINS